MEAGLVAAVVAAGGTALGSYGIDLAEAIEPITPEPAFCFAGAEAVVVEAGVVGTRLLAPVLG